MDWAQIQQTQDIHAMQVEVPEWGMTCFIKTLSRAEHDQWEVVLTSTPDDKRGDIRIALVGLCLCDENGNRIVPDDKFAELGTKHFKAIERLYEAAVKHNSLGNDAVEDAKKN